MNSELNQLRQMQKKWEQDICFDASILGKAYHFRSTWGVFSPEKIDDGSLMLLDYIDFAPTLHSIDLGCGYGVLGMVAARECPQGQHVLIDKDYVAVDYARKNCQANKLDNTTVLLSNGFSAVGAQKFDLVMSNLPAKASKEQHYLYLLNAYDAMNVGASFYVVTINGLREYMKKSFSQVFGNSKKLKQGSTYTITVATKTE